MQVTSSGFHHLYGYAASSISKNEAPSSASKRPDSPLGLSSAEITLITKLSATDTKVRAHEAAHIAAGGGVVNSGASFSYIKGPDGKMYAIGGEVPIDTSEGKTPGETIAKARQIIAAAMAPADPSPQDYKVATSAAMMEMRAHLEEMKTLQESTKGKAAYAQNSLNAEDSTTKLQSEEELPAIR